MNIEEEIISYNLDLKVDYIFKKYNQEDIINTVLDIFEKTSAENKLNISLFMSIMAFVTDTIVFSDLSDDDAIAFKEKLFQMNFFDKIEKYLYSDYLTIRQVVIHSIGKLSIRDNVIYLEKAFEKYLNRNPITCSELLGEIRHLKSEKYEQYYSLLENDMDLINSMTLCIHLWTSSSKAELTKVFNSFKMKFKSIFGDRTIDVIDYPTSYTIMVQNTQSFLKQKDWTRDEYIKSIIYYTKYYGEIFNGVKTDYQKIYNEMIK